MRCKKTILRGAGSEQRTRWHGIEVEGDSCEGRSAINAIQRRMDCPQRYMRC